MDATEALNIYDSFWFEMEILSTRSTTISSDSPPESPTTMASMYMQQAPPLSDFSNSRATRGGQTTMFRSMSEDLYTKPSFNTTTTTTPASPDSVLNPQISRGDSEFDFTNYSPTPPPRPPRKGSPTPSGSNSPPKATPGRRRRATKEGAGTKSLSSLEFEELKGFMDLGFVFSEEDKDSRLVSILPGLQRLGKKDGGDQVAAATPAVNESAIPRPYLSEAWEVQEKERMMRKPVMNWRVPALGLGSEVDMKESLREWAQTVASTVR